MEQIARLKNSFFEFISPAKRRRTLPARLTENEPEQDYLPNSAQALRSVDHVHKEARASYQSPSVARNPRKRAREDDEDTPFKPESASPSDLASQESQAEDESSDEESAIDQHESEAEDLNNATVEEPTPEDEVEEYLARQATLALRIQDIENVKAAGDFHEDEIFLFERLALRSFEPLMPDYWAIDFPTLPWALFTKDADKQFINHNCVSSGHGVKVLSAFMGLGGRVRGNVLSGTPTERMMAREINHYVKWSEMDGGFRGLRSLPVLTIVAAKSGESIEAIGASITTQMAFLAKQHRQFLALPAKDSDQLHSFTPGYRRNPPLLYGMIIAHSMVIFVTLNSANPDAKIRHLQHFDFKDKDMDVWNVFALAIMIIIARNYNMAHKHEFEADDPPSDPDL